MNFEFATSARISFGPGAIQNAAKAAAFMGKRVLLVLGKNPARARPLAADLEQSGLPVTFFQIPGEPTIDLARNGADSARQNKCDLVIGFGGGSVIDGAKAIAALCTNPGDPLDYLEVIGRARALIHAPLPMIAIPTTAGTGSEVTRNAVLSSLEKKVKVSLRHPLMLPRLAIVDPELTYSLPPAVSAATGLDALTQLIEPFLSNAANPLTDALCREGISRAAHSLRKVWLDGSDAQAREDMALASLFGGLALANAKLGAVHGFASPIGGMFPAPHGEVCARLLPLVLQTNLRALRQRQPDAPVLTRFEEIGKLLTGTNQAQAEDGVAWLKATCEMFGIPGLGSFGVLPRDIPAVVQQARQASSMKGNPIVLSDDELEEILQAAI